jgi:2'-5' RNA ligase
VTKRDGGPGYTIGVAVAIPSPFGEVLDAARGRFEPAWGEMPAHVTVLPPIDVDVDAMPAVMRHLEAVAADTPAFRMSLSGSGTFRPLSPVVFVVVDEGAPDLERLEGRVRSGDMAVESRFPYHPHVTIAHDVTEERLDQALAELDGFSAAMPIRSMGLYEHVDGTWTLLHEFDFAVE